ncbi:hypothetical protein HK096_005210, partial [Nowakowskiella sp. JEL0078]
YDIPAALNVPLQKWLGTSYEEYQWQINLLYSVYSLPNIFLPLIGGILIDVLGPAKMLLLFSSLVCIGQSVFSAGISYRHFPTIAFGRFLFGVGGESLEVAQARVTTDWFRGRGLAFALSLNLSFARFATALNDNASPWIESRTGSVPLAGWFGLLVCIVSFFSGVVVVILDQPVVRKQAGVYCDEELESERNPLLKTNENLNFNVDGYGSISNGSNDQGSSSRNTRANVINGNNLAIDTIPIDVDFESEEYDENDETVHLNQIVGFGGLFWLLCLITIVLYVSFFHICTDFFQKKWYPGDTQKAGLVMSIPDLISAVGSPICGLFVDKYGHRSTVLPISALLLLLTHALLNYTLLSPIIAMSIMGISYSVFAAALWPCVSYLVGRHQIATAYGIVTVALNVSLFFFPLVVAKIRNNSMKLNNKLNPENPNKKPDYSNFENVEIFFMVLSFAAFVLSLLLMILDWKLNNGILAKPHHFSQLSPVSGILPDDDSCVDSQAVDDGPENFITTKVIGEGIMIPVQQTVVHHRHHCSVSFKSQNSALNEVTPNNAYGAGNELHFGKSWASQCERCLSTSPLKSPMQ